jgi:hypothetical protein
MMNAINTFQGMAIASSTMIMIAFFGVAAAAILIILGVALRYELTERRRNDPGRYSGLMWAPHPPGTAPHYRGVGPTSTGTSPQSWHSPTGEIGIS